MDISQIKKLRAEATPGKWRMGQPTFRCKKDHKHGNGDCVHSFDGWMEDTNDDKHFWGCYIYVDRNYAGREEEEKFQIAGTWDYEDGGIRHKSDAQFIAALPQIADECIRLMEENEELKKKLENV